mgnify:FL=1
MRRFFRLFKQDLVLAFRNAMMPVLVFLIVMMAVTVRFVLPKDWQPAETYYFVDQTEGAPYETVLRQSGVDPGKFLSDEEALRGVVRKDRGGIGVLFTGSKTHPRITIMHSDVVTPQGVNILKATLNAMVRRVTGSEGRQFSGESSRVRFLRPQAEPVPLNLTALPGLIAFEVIVLGFMFVAVFIFQEKHEGTIKAYRVSPGGKVAYVLSKTLAFAVLGSVYGCGVLASTMGRSVNYGAIVPLMALGAALYTLIGISVASFFQDLSEWLLPAVLLLTVNMIPAASMVFPTFSPRWLSYVPSYPAVFAIREVLFPSGKPILPLVGALVAESVAAYALCLFLTERNLMKEGRSWAPQGRFR